MYISRLSVLFLRPQVRCQEVLAVSHLVSIVSKTTNSKISLICEYVQGLPEFMSKIKFSSNVTRDYACKNMHSLFVSLGISKLLKIYITYLNLMTLTINDPL